MRRFVMAVSVALVLVLLAGAAPDSGGVQGQDLSVLKAKLEKKIQEHEDKVAGWERDGSILFSLTLAVIIMGAACSALQKYQGKSIRVAVSIMSALVAILTTADTALYDESYKALDLRVEKARASLWDIDMTLAEYHDTLPRSVRLENLEMVRDQLREFDRRRLFEAVEHVSAPLFELIPTAYAGNRPEPEWVKSPPRGKDDLFFVGVCESRSMKKAKDLSRRSAVEEAIAYFSAEFERRQSVQSSLDVDKLSEYLADAGEVVETHFVRDEMAQVYRYYSLFRLSRDMVDLDLSFYAIEKDVAIPQGFEEAVQTAAPLGDSYYARRTAVYEQKVATARAEVRPDVFEAFTEGRYLRQIGQPEAARPLLRSVIEENDRFYMGWYNLALAEFAVDNPALADSSFRRAIELEPQQAERDASLYNTYGYFLFQRERYEEAREMLQRAVEIDPDHAKARRTLKAVEEKLPE